MTSRILHLKEAAELCGVPAETVREWIDRGLRTFALGHATQRAPRDFLIREEWLLEFIEAQSTVRPKGSPEKTQSQSAQPPAVVRKPVAARHGRLRCPV